MSRSVAATFAAAYATGGAAIDLGRAVHDGAPLREAAGDFLHSRQGKALQRTVTRGILGMLPKRF